MWHSAQVTNNIRLKLHTKSNKIANEISYVAQFFMHLVSNPQTSCNYAAHAVNEILKNICFFSYLLYQQLAESSKLKSFSDSL